MAGNCGDGENERRVDCWRDREKKREERKNVRERKRAREKRSGERT